MNETQDEKPKTLLDSLEREKQELKRELQKLSSQIKEFINKRTEKEVK